MGRMDRRRMSQAGTETHGASSSVGRARRAGALWAVVEGTARLAQGGGGNETGMLDQTVPGWGKTVGGGTSRAERNIHQR